MEDSPEKILLEIIMAQTSDGKFPTVNLVKDLFFQRSKAKLIPLSRLKELGVVDFSGAAGVWISVDKNVTEEFIDQLKIDLGARQIIADWVRGERHGH